MLHYWYLKSSYTNLLVNRTILRSRMEENVQCILFLEHIYGVATNICTVPGNQQYQHDMAQILPHKYMLFYQIKLRKF